MRKGWAPVLDGVVEVAEKTGNNVQQNLRWAIAHRGLKPPVVASLAGLGDRTLDNTLSGMNVPELRVVSACAAVLAVEPWQLLLPHQEFKRQVLDQGEVLPLVLRPAVGSDVADKAGSRSGSPSSPRRKAVGQNKGAKRTLPTTPHLRLVSDG